MIRRGYADTRWGQVHYREAGPRRGQPIVMLHQTASSSAMFEALMERLADAHWCLALDIPGFGQSFAPDTPPSMTWYADVIDAALDALGAGTCRIFGHHTGASIAVDLLSRKPARASRLILGGPPMLTPEQRRYFASRALPAEDSLDGSHFCAAWAALHARNPDTPVGLLNREALLALQAVRAHESYQAVFGQDFAAQLATVQCPTLMLAGDRDTLFDSLARAHAALPGSQMRVIQGADTYVCETHADQLAGIVRGFFS